MNRKMTLSAKAFLVTGTVLGGLHFYTVEPDIRARVGPGQQVFGQPIRYRDSTRQAEEWRWEFGNGRESRQDKGLYYYDKPGRYLIRLTVNGQLTRSFPVLIKPTPPVNELDSIVRIQGPLSGYEGEKLVFTAVGGGARRFSWRFGASSHVDARGQTAIYSYPEEEDSVKSGPYTRTIELRTDRTKYPITRRITIFRGYVRLEAPVQLVDRRGDDIRERLQQIADGQSFNGPFRYILRTYLCNQNDTPVRINDTKVNDFYSYCMGLQFDRGVRIDDVALTSDTLTSCVLRLNVVQHKP